MKSATSQPASPKLSNESADGFAGRNPQARFSKLSEKLRQVTPDDLQCSVFCGGKKCKYESGTQWEPKDMAINGLFSHWVTDDILACARPNSASIDKYAIIDQFKKCEIRSIINLQSRGEHSRCGPTLHDSGFSYDPQLFMQNNIFFYNFSIKDYGVASQNFVLDMVKVLAFALTEGKVAIHCHAGLGRTCVLIACFLCFALRVQANDAIRYVRVKRPNSIQTRNQILCIQSFCRFISLSSIIFPKSRDQKDAFSLLEHLQRQKRVLHGYEARNLKYIPKLVYTICERLLDLCHCSDKMPQTCAKGRRLIALHSSEGPFWKSYLAANTAEGDSFSGSMDSNKSQDDQNSLARVVVASMGKATLPPYTQFKRLTPTKVLCRGLSSPALMQDLSSAAAMAERKSPSSPVLNKLMLASMDMRSFSSEGLPYSSWDQESITSSDAGSLLDVPLEDDSLVANNETTVVTVSSTIDEDVTQNPCFKELVSLADVRKAPAVHVTLESAILPAENLAKLFIALQAPPSFDSDFECKCREYQENLNTKSTAWDCLSSETDPKILLALLISWFHMLQKPVLDSEELAKVMPFEKDENIVDVIGRFSTACRFVFEYLVRFVHRLRVLSEVTRDKLVDRVTDLLLTNVCCVARADASDKDTVVGIVKRMLQHITTLDKLAESPISR